jgi:hypothetical protein
MPAFVKAPNFILTDILEASIEFKGLNLLLLNLLNLSKGFNVVNKLILIKFSVSFLIHVLIVNTVSTQDFPFQNPIFSCINTGSSYLVIS